MTFRIVGLVFSVLYSLTATIAFSEQVKITAQTDVSPAGIAKIILQESSSTFPADVLELIVDMWTADVVVEGCRDLRKNETKVRAKWSNMNHKYSARGWDNQDFDKQLRHLPEERMGELIGYRLYSLGLDPDDPSTFCAVGRSQMKKNTQLGSFLLE